MTTAPMNSDRPDPPAPPPARRHSGGKLLAGALALLLVAVLAVGVAAWWAVGTASGSAWLLSIAPGVKIDTPIGALARDFSARRLDVDLPGANGHVTVTDVRWGGLSLRGGDGPLWAHLTIATLAATRVDVVLTPKPDPKSAPLKSPADLKLPIEVELQSLKVGEIHATPLGDTAISGLDAALHLGADAGAVHRVDHLSLRVQQITLGARARVASAAPMALEAVIDASQEAIGSLPAWVAKLKVAGPLAEPVLDATLRASPVAVNAAAAAPPPAAPATTSTASSNAAARPTPSLDLHAVLRPFAPWPLGDLTASAKSLDLSAFVGAAPTTSLAFDARATSSGVDRPAVVTVDLTNGVPGRYDEGRLPVQSVKAELAARPDRATQIELRSVDALLGSAAEPGGRMTAQGRWSPSSWQLDATLDGLRPRRLDGRAPVLTLNGGVHAAGGAVAADGKGIDLKTDLTGELDDAGTRRPVSVHLDTSLNLDGSDKRVHLAALQASAGNAKIKASGTATQATPTAPWVVKADASMADFDPGVWVPGADKSPWRGTKNRVNAQVVVDAAAALPAAGMPVLDALAAARGRATLTIADTVLAGVAVAGTAAVQGSGGQDARIQADIDAGGNSLHVDGRLGTGGKASAGTDAFDLALDARSLATLAPVFKLFQPPGADATLTGRLTVHAHLDGRWPGVTTRGDLDAQGVQAGAIGVQRAVAQWVAGTATTDRVSLNATIDGVKMQARGGPPGPSVEAATVQLGGTARAHTLDVRLTSRARPPAWAEAATDTAAPARSASSLSAGPAGPVTSSGGVAPPMRLTVATLSAHGGLIDQKDAALSGWRGTLQSIDVISNSARAAPLLRGRDLSLEAFWAGGPVRAAVQPGRLELLGGVVRWSEMRYAAAASSVTVTPGRTHSSAPLATTGALPRIDVEATIEPLRIAPLLAQAQPSFGWGGDLGIGGHLRLHTGGTLDGDRRDSGVHADAVVERSGGDLTITDEFGTRPLGLSDLRVSLTAERGLWNVTTRFTGRSLGTATADASVRTSPQLLLPADDAPLSGRVALDIADLGALGNWVPSGWRVGGALRADATLAGRFGKPDYSGQIVGSRINARNFLEGVNATDGDLLVRLEGSRATIDHFTAKGGDGTLRVTGGATFDAGPDVKLDITADKLLVLGRIDRKIVASGSAAVHIDSRTIGVGGKFSIDQGLIDITRSDAPKLDEDVTVIRAAGVLSPAAAASAAELPVNNAPVPIVAVVGPPATEPPPPVRTVDLNLQLDLGQQLAIRGHGLAARLAGILKVTSPGSQVAVNGTVSVVDGTYKAYGQDLVIDRGLIAFTGPIDRPRLDIEATRPKLENMRVGVTITGSTANPRIRLFSEPDMSDVDKLSWLVVGRGSDDLGRNESALLQSAAMALVAGEGNGEPGITDRVTKALGLDELSLGQSDGAVKQTVVNVGKKLSDRWTIGYQAGLNAAAGSVQLIYKIAKRLTVRAQAGTESSLDLIWTWRWE